ncbi:MAG TPA: nucleotide exchange factor GrpE [Gammaproteobacteria bacterium]|nr:nucleotide exchange factor GrpE [Gammaproteobacteria bacterium]
MSDEQAAAAAEITQPAGQGEHNDASVAATDDPLDALKAALAAAEQKAAENWENYLRLAAEMENLRKRAQRDLENAHKFALERFLGELLPVKDSLELGIAAADNAETAGHREGMDMTLKLLGSVIERAGVTELAPARGDSFNPELHEAMAMQESTEAEPGAVLATVQKGYQLNGRLLRPARVLVAKAPAPAA